MPPTVARTHIPKTDADLRPIFDAYCRGAGQRLTWRMQQVYPTEQIARFGVTVAQVEAAARRYVAGMTDGIAPSYPKFAADFDRWRAEAERPGRGRTAGTTGGLRRADDPRLGAPSAAASNVEYACRLGCRTMHKTGDICPIKAKAEQERANAH